MMKPISVSVAALFFGTLGAVAPAHSATLEEALAAAYVSNPLLQAERARVRAVDEQVPQALSGWRPRVFVTGETGVQKTESNVRADPEETSNPRTVALSVTQPLFRGFRTVNETEAAEFQVLAARSELTSTEQEVLLAAATAYMDVLRDIAVLELNTSNEQVLRRQLEAARDRFQVGEITRTDVSQGESRLAGAIAARIAAVANLQTTRATFERIIGFPPVNLEAPAVVPNLPTSLEEAINLAKEQQPEVLAATYSAQAAQESIEVVRGELLPTVSLEAGISRQWDEVSEGSEVDGEQILATVSVPLYQGGAVYARLREAKHLAGQQKLLVDQAQVASRELAIQAWEELQAAQAQIQSISAQVESAQIALEGVQREAQVGARTVLDVLDSEQELLDARVDLVGAQRNERVAAFALLSAVGRLTAGSLGLPVEVYDPSVHYEAVDGKWFGGTEWADQDAAGEPMGPTLSNAATGEGTAQ